MSRNTDAAKISYYIKRAREDFSVFRAFCFDRLNAPHQQGWNDIIKTGDGVPQLGSQEGHRFVQIQAPRCHGKSTYMRDYMLWEIGHNPNQFIGICTCEDKLATSQISAMEEHIKGNKRLQAVFPDLMPGDIWSKTQFNVIRDVKDPNSTVRGAGIFSTGVGFRAHLLIIDDPTSFRTSVQYPNLREATKEIFDRVWMNYLFNNGRCVYIATPWHIDDLTCVLENRSSWYSWKKPAIIDGEPLWEEQFDLEELDRRRKEDERAFEEQYMLIPYTDTDTSFDFDDIERACVDDFPEEAESWPKVMGVDLAPMGRKSTKNSVSAVTTVTSSPKGIRHHIDTTFIDESAPDTMNIIVDLAHRHNAQMIIVENNAFQQAMVDFLSTKAPHLPVVGYRTGSQKMDIDRGVPSLSYQLRDGKWRFKITTMEMEQDEHPTNKLLEQMRSFPHGKRDDGVMSLWFAEIAARRIFGGTEVIEYNDVGEVSPIFSAGGRNVGSSANDSDDNNTPIFTVG